MTATDVAEDKPPALAAHASSNNDDGGEGRLLRRRTGLVCNDTMLDHRQSLERGKHIECPERILAIQAELKETGLFEQCVDVASRDVTDEEILALHTQDHLDEVSRIMTLPTQSEIDEICDASYESVYMNHDSYSCASIAAGSTIELVNYILQGTIENGLAVVRPPGHHAEPGECCGFGIFNNIALAAAAARQSCDRVLIVDWDIHHGNGTQRMFGQDPNVLYFSIHRYDNATFFPYSTDARPEYIGSGDGIGKTVNCAWNVPLNDEEGMGDDDYLAVFHTLLLPIAAEFQPNIVLVSAGFDAAKGDRYGFSVTSNGFAQMTRLLLQNVSSKVALVLEGGYYLDGMPRCVAACLQELIRNSNGDASGSEQENEMKNQEPAPKASAVRCINATLRALTGYWASLPEQIKLPTTMSQGRGPSSSKRDRKAQRQQKQQHKSRPVTGVSIAGRNTAESKWKSDIRKLQRHEKEIRQSLDEIQELKSRLATNGGGISKREAKLLHGEWDYQSQLDDIVLELEDLTSLSKADAVRYYAATS